MRLVTLLLLLTLAGCAWQTEHREPLLDSNPPPAWHQSGALAGEPAGRWWLAFEDPELNGLVERLLQQNLQLEQALARLEQARATVRTVRSARLPSLTLTGQGGYSKEPTLLGDVDGTSYRLAGAAAFEIDLWGKLAARTRAAGKRLEASREEAQTLLLGLTSQLADLYYLAVEQRAQLELATETIASFRDTRERVEERYRLGAVPAVDLYQARQALAAAEANRHQIQANLATTEHAIAVLLGEYPAAGEEGSLAELPELPTSFPAGLPATLIARRPDLRSALRQIEAADAELAAAIADRFPSINLTGSYGLARQDFSTGLVDGDFVSLLGNLTLPLVDAGRRRAEVERNRAVVNERLASYRLAVLTAFREVEDTLALNRETEARIDRLAATKDAATATLRLSLDRYYLGVTDYLPVLTAQRNAFDARSRLLAARRSLLSARIELARALGGDWMLPVLEQRLSRQEDDQS